MAVKKKLFLISIPFILAYLYFDSTRIPTVLNQVDTSNYLAREPKKSKIPVVLNQDQAINELDPDCQCRHVVPKGLMICSNMMTVVEFHGESHSNVDYTKA